MANPTLAPTDYANWTDRIAHHLRRAAILMRNLADTDALRLAEGGTYDEEASDIDFLARQYEAEAAYALGRVHSLAERTPDAATAPQEDDHAS